MANKPKRSHKSGVSKNEHHHNEYVSIVKHFESEVPFNKLHNANTEQLPEKYFDANKNVNVGIEKRFLSPKKRIIKYSSISKASAEPTRANAIHDITTLCSHEQSGNANVNRKKKRSPLPTSNKLQSNNKGKSNVIGFISKSSKELESNARITNYNFLKSPSETNTNSTCSSFSIADNQITNKDMQFLPSKTDNVETHSVDCDTDVKLPFEENNDKKSTSLIDVIDKKVTIESTRKSASYGRAITSNDIYHRENISQLNEETRNTNSKNKRRHIAELKTEIAEYRSKVHSTNDNLITVKRSLCQIQTVEKAAGSVTSLRKQAQERVESTYFDITLNAGHGDIFDPVSVALPTKDTEYCQFPILPTLQLGETLAIERPLIHTDTSEVEADVSEDDASISGFSTGGQQTGDTSRSYKKDLDSDMELNSKIEQNKLLINKVQKVLNIIKMGVTYSSATELDGEDKSEDNPSAVNFREDLDKHEEITSHTYEMLNDSNVEGQESKSDCVEGIHSYDSLQGEALKAQAAKSDVETAVRTLEDTTSEDTFKPTSVTDEEVLGNEINKIEEIIKENVLDDVKVSGIHQHRPLTRRCEKRQWLEDKYRTEPTANTSYPKDMTAIDILQAKLNTIHDTESESAAEEVSVAESVPTGLPTVPVNGNVFDTHINPISNEQKTKAGVEEPNLYLKPSDNNDLSFKQKLPDNGECNADIHQDFPLQSDIIDDDCTCDVVIHGNRNKSKSKYSTKIPQFVKSPRSCRHCRGKSTKKTDISVNTKIYSSRNCMCNTDPIIVQPKESKDIASNTEYAHENKEVGINTDAPAEMVDTTSSVKSLNESKESGCNTENMRSCKNCATNTYQTNELKDATCFTEVLDSYRHVSCNTERHDRDFGFNVKPQQKNIVCEAKIYSDHRDVDCETENFQIKTSNASCSTYIRTASTAVQKNEFEENSNMIFENMEQVNIASNNYFKKSGSLQFQLLPSINIISLPTIQRVLQFYIDQNGKSHLAYKPSQKSISYIEVQSPSCTKESVVQKRETQKMQKDNPYNRKPKCKFLIDRKYNQEYESGSEAERMLKQTMTLSRNIFPSDATTSVEDCDFLNDNQNSQTIKNKDGTSSYLTKNDKYLKRTLSDSSMIIRTIKEVSARALLSESDTNSRLESLAESNQIDSTENSSHWVGEFTSKIDEKVYKTFIDPNGSSIRGQWKYKTETNLDDFEKINRSRDVLNQKKSCKTIQTQTSPPTNLQWTTLKMPGYFPLGTHLTSPISLLETTNRVRDGISTQTPVQTVFSLETATQTPLETTDKSLMTEPVNQLIQISTNAFDQNQIDPSTRKTLEIIKDLSDIADDIYEQTNKSNSWEHISLTISCSTYDDSASRKHTPLMLQPSLHSEKLKPILKKHSPKSEETWKHPKYGLKDQIKEKPKTEGSIRKERFEKKEEKSPQKSRRTQEKYAKKNVKDKRGGDASDKDWTKCQQLEEPQVKNKSKIEVLPLADKRKILNAERSKQPNESDNVGEDVVSKFRNVHMIENDAPPTKSITKDSYYSEGEIKSNCSVSSGEIYSCKRENRHVQSLNSFRKNIGIVPIRRKKNYFNSWITYYFDKNSLENKSSSTSYG